MSIVSSDVGVSQINNPVAERKLQVCSHIGLIANSAERLICVRYCS